MLAKMDEFGKPAWIAATLVGFFLFWPLGLAILAYLAWSGRLAAMRQEAPGQWSNLRSGLSRGFAPRSGNQAFDDYRAETLRRLEEEQKEFVEYLERLRRARDKAEFDQFMADRGRQQGSTVDTNDRDSINA